MLRQASDGLRDRIGTYRLLERLGQGSMGTVFKALHPETGRLVALKTLEEPSAGHLPTLRREIQALGRLRHPGIVRILDHGTEGGLPWYAAELLEGRTLRGIPDLPRALSIVCRLCRALAYLHGEGLLHRDLKPDNVLVLADGQPVLVDFGLAMDLGSVGGRDRLEPDLGASGTLLYMAPEAIQGQSVDPRADLYGLGCLLFELLTGRPPFTSNRAREVLQAHLQREPEAPSSLRPGLPLALDQLVLQLLRKDPAQRIGYADEVADVLVALGAVEPPSAPARAYLYRPRLAGRAALLERIAGPRKGLLLIAGASGLGKTRLALEAGQAAVRRGMRVFFGEGLDPDGAALHVLLRPLTALADRCREDGPEETERLFGRSLGLLAPYCPALAELPDPRPWSAPPLAPDAARQRLFKALAELFQAAGAGEPVTLLLDDLHRADEASLGFLAFLQRTESAPDVSVVAFHRPDEATALQGLAGSASRAGLEPLTEAEVGSLVADMLAVRRPPPVFVRFLTRRSEGSPFLVAETLRTAVAENLLCRRAGQWVLDVPAAAEQSEPLYEALPFPQALDEIVLRRLKDLQAEAGRSLAQRAIDAGRSFAPSGADAGRSLAVPENNAGTRPRPKKRKAAEPAGGDMLALAECLAVLGRQAPLSQLERLTGWPESRGLAALDQLLRRGILEESQPSVARFSHQRFRDLISAALEPTRRQALHRAAAEALADSGAPPAELARHWEAALEVDRARPCYLEAARQAVARWAPGDAAPCYRAFLRLSPEPSGLTVAARNELGHDVLPSLGYGVEALEQHRQALAEATLLQDAAAIRESQRLLGNACRRLSRWAEAEEHLERAQVLCVLASDRAGLARTLADRGALEQGRGHFELALSFAQSALVLQIELGDIGAQADLERQIATAFSNLGRLEEAFQAAQRALQHHRSLGLPVDEARSLATFAGLAQSLGRPQQAHESLQRALQLQIEAGNRPGQARVLGDLAGHHGRLGQYQQGLACEEQALEIFREVGDRHGESIVLANLAGSFHLLGRLEQAHTLNLQALALQRELGDEYGEGLILSNLAELHRDRGELDAAFPLYQQALEKLERSGDTRHLADVMCELAGLQRRAGRDLGQADALLLRAETLLRETGDREYLGLCLCERGLLELALGRPATAWLQEARELFHTDGYQPDSELGRCLTELEQAISRPLDHP